MYIGVWGKVGERDHLEDIDVNGKRIKMGLQKICGRSLEWLDLTQVRDTWRSVVSTVMTIRFVQNAVNVLIKLGTISVLRMALINEASLFVCLFFNRLVSYLVTYSVSQSVCLFLYVCCLFVSFFVYNLTRKIGNSVVLVCHDTKI